METGLVTGIASIIGGILVSVTNYFLHRRDAEARRNLIEAEADAKRQTSAAAAEKDLGEAQLKRAEATKVLAEAGLARVLINSPLLPDGWLLALEEGTELSDYLIGVDSETFYAGHASVYIKALSLRPRGFGALVQRISATHYLGSRLAFSGRLKYRDVRVGCGLWMRIDTPDGTGAFDNMQDRPALGTSNWTEYRVVLDVNPDATTINFGLILFGDGEVWMDDLRLEQVGGDVPTTDAWAHVQLPEHPVNLDFENQGR